MSKNNPHVSDASSLLFLLSCEKCCTLHTKNIVEYISQLFHIYLPPEHSPKLNGLLSLNTVGIMLSATHSLAKTLSPATLPQYFGLPLILWEYIHCLSNIFIHMAALPAHSSLPLLYLWDGNGYQFWDLKKKAVVKSRDVLFVNSTFLYPAQLISPPTMVQAEILRSSISAPWSPPLINSPQYLLLPPHLLLLPSFLLYRFLSGRVLTTNYLSQFKSLSTNHGSLELHFPISLNFTDHHSPPKSSLHFFSFFFSPDLLLYNLCVLFWLDYRLLQRDIFIFYNVAFGVAVTHRIRGQFPPNTLQKLCTL
ncbi:uncharacterized protein VP01_835g1 [Puccinia sorghi]|uniref:Uncharacterized protein n=1 Tax=Puccinia sorghi TaxID=27349 RepID=A0A0L6U9I7_9BASI|nr:uncharacterized protein VP01_835g1 [Puccinia sorghi]